MAEQLLTLEQVAKALQIPPATLYRWRYMRTGPPALKIGRFLRYREGDVASWLDRQGRPEQERADAP